MNPQKFDVALANKTVREVLAEKVADLIEAEAAIQARLQVMYPVGTRWLFVLQRRQTNSSVGEVIGHTGGANCVVRFRLDAKKHQREHQRHVVGVPMDMIEGRAP